MTKRKKKAEAEALAKNDHRYAVCLAGIRRRRHEYYERYRTDFMAAYDQVTKRDEARE